MDAVIPLTISSLYFYFGGIYWKVPFFPALLFPFIGLIFLWFLPESPRYLYERKMFTRLREVIKQYARVNGSNMDHDYKIDEEVKANQQLNKIQESSSCQDEKSSTDISQQVEQYSIMKSLKDGRTLPNLIIVMI